MREFGTARSDPKLASGGEEVWWGIIGHGSSRSNNPPVLKVNRIWEEGNRPKSPRGTNRDQQTEQTP